MTLSTDNIAPEKRLECWNDWISDSFTALQATPIQSNRDFNGSLECSQLSSLSMSRVLSGPSHVQHTAQMTQLATEEVFLLHLQGEGSSVHRQAGREAVLKPGDFTLCDSARPYSVSFDQDNEMYVLRIPKKRINEFLVSAEDLVGQPMDASRGVAAMVSNMFRSAWNNQVVGDGSSQFQSKLEDNVLNMLSLSYMEQYQQSRVTIDPQQQRLIEVKNFIDVNLNSMNLNLDTVAAAQRISKRYLHKLFSDEGITVARYLQGRRLDQACSMLKDKRFKAESIEAIAFQVGFHSASHFSRLFKANFHITPNQFRQTEVC